MQTDHGAAASNKRPILNLNYEHERMCVLEVVKCSYGVLKSALGEYLVLHKIYLSTGPSLRGPKAIRRLN